MNDTIKKAEVKILVTLKSIKDRIYNIRGLQVMLDRDLAEMYNVKPTRLREQVKRNINRFPNDFMFQLNSKEVDFMVSQNAIPSRKHLGGHLPYAFTEQGVASISSVLTSDVAIEVNIKIMRAFVEMRKFIAGNSLLFQQIDRIETNQQVYQIKTEEKFELIFKALEDKSIKPKQGLFYDGQVFDAYSLIADITRSANKSIILIDNYVDDTVLKLFTKKRKKSGLHSLN